MAIAGIAIAFVAITLLVQKKVALGPSLMIGALIVGLTSGQSPLQIAVISYHGLLETTSVNLITTLGMISMLGYIMQKQSLLTKMVASLQVVLRSTKLTIMLVPSIIGTLLVTGGAIMSAPTVGSLGKELELPGEKLSAINLVFRHGWYFVYPLMPAFVMVTSITGVPLNTLLLVQLPLTIAILVAGYFTYLHRIPDQGRDKPRPKPRDVMNLLAYTSPIWLSLLLTVVWRWPFPLALIVGMALALIVGRARLSEVPSLLWKGLNWTIILSGAGIMVFRAVTSKVDALPILIDNMLQAGLPARALFILLPFLAGLVSASNTSALGLTLPLLLPAMESTGLVLFGTVAAYTSSFIGYFASPLHLCQVVTLAHFECKIMELYREYRIPFLAVAGTLGLLSFLI
jgi:integral membrane protein (TIGR00529 family)